MLAAIARDAAAGRTSTAVLEEVWHLERSGRVGDIGGVTQAAYEILTPLLAVDDAIFRASLDSEGHGLGTDDRLHAATCAVPGLRRVDPLDEDALGSLVV